MTKMYLFNEDHPEGKVFDKAQAPLLIQQGWRECPTQVGHAHRPKGVTSNADMGEVAQMLRDSGYVVMTKEEYEGVVSGQAVNVSVPEPPPRVGATLAQAQPEASAEAPEPEETPTLQDSPTSEDEGEDSLLDQFLDSPDLLDDNELKSLAKDVLGITFPANILRATLITKMQTKIETGEE